MSSIGQSFSVPVSVGAKYHLAPITFLDGDPTELQSDVNGYLKVNVTTLGAKGQTTMANSLPVTIASDQSNLKTNLYDGAGVAVPMGQGLMAASLPVTLASNQSDINIRLKDGAGSAVNKGQGLMAASLPVTLASDQSAIPATQSGTWNMRLQDGAGSAVNKGQGLMAASLPVTLASDQSNLKANLYDGAGSAVSKGQGLMAASLPVALASDQSAIPVKLQDSAGSGVAKGQTTMTGSLPVTLASDQSALQVVGSAASAAADSGNPVKIGGKFNTTLPTFTNGQRGDIQIDSRGRQIVISDDTGKIGLSVIDQIDTVPGPLLDASSTTINNNVGAFVVAVATLAAACKKIRVADTTGAFIGVYTGAAASEVLAFIINPGMSNEIEHSIPASTRITLRAMDANAITSGLLTMQFLG